MSGRARPSGTGPGEVVTTGELDLSGQEVAVHTISCAAPPSVLYELVADVSRWSAILASTIDIRHIDRSEHAERFRLWALAGGQVQTWVSQRGLDPDHMRITFQQERTEPPIVHVNGEWEFQPLDGGGTRVMLRHRFTVDGDSAGRERIAAADSSTRELAALCRLAEFGHPIDQLVFSFSNQVRLPVSVADAYSFVYRSDKWSEVLPHVSRVVLTEPQPDVQDMEMDTVTADGRTHTTRSVRLCFPHERIVYKQLVAPRLLLGHSGAWHFAADDAGTLVAARHTVAVNPVAVADVLGPGSVLEDACEYLRGVLGANSRATLSHAGAQRRLV